MRQADQRSWQLRAGRFRQPVSRVHSWSSEVLILRLLLSDTANKTPRISAKLSGQGASSGGDSGGLEVALRRGGTGMRRSERSIANGTYRRDTECCRELAITGRSSTSLISQQSEKQSEESSEKPPVTCWPPLIGLQINRKSFDLDLPILGQGKSAAHRLFTTNKRQQHITWGATTLWSPSSRIGSTSKLRLRTTFWSHGSVNMLRSFWLVLSLSSA